MQDFPLWGISSKSLKMHRAPSGVHPDLSFFVARFSDARKTINARREIVRKWELEAKTRH